MGEIRSVPLEEFVHALGEVAEVVSGSRMEVEEVAEAKRGEPAENEVARVGDVNSLG